MKGKQPLVSIYSTVFNNSKIIRKSIDSIIRQLPDFSRNFELVIVDNFSTDGTWDIIKEYMLKHDNIVALQLHCNRGRAEP